jgi:hypothetical protein
MTMHRRRIALQLVGVPRPVSWSVLAAVRLDERRLCIVIKQAGGLVDSHTDSLLGERHVVGVEIDPDKAATEVLGDHTGCPRTGERVKHDTGLGLFGVTLTRFPPTRRSLCRPRKFPEIPAEGVLRLPR